MPWNWQLPNWPKFRYDPSDKEYGMDELLCSAYRTYDAPLTHEMLWEWHCMLFKGSSLEDCGHYQTHPEPIHIISNRADGPRAHFDAPPSKRFAMK